MSLWTASGPSETLRNELMADVSSAIEKGSLYTKFSAVLKSTAAGAGREDGSPRQR